MKQQQNINTSRYLVESLNEFIAEWVVDSRDQRRVYYFDDNGTFRKILAIDTQRYKENQLKVYVGDENFGERPKQMFVVEPGDELFVKKQDSPEILVQWEMNYFGAVDFDEVPAWRVSFKYDEIEVIVRLSIQRKFGQRYEFETPISFPGASSMTVKQAQKVATMLHSATSAVEWYRWRTNDQMVELNSKLIWDEETEGWRRPQ